MHGSALPARSAASPPAPIVFAHRLVRRQAELRRSGALDWLRPDAKSQVSFRYEDGRPVAIEAVVLSTQHAADIDTAARPRTAAARSRARIRRRWTGRPRTWRGS